MNWEEKTYIPGVTMVKDAKGNRVRQKPLPTHKQPHFINAAKRAQYEAGAITLEQATKPVFIFTGAGRNTVKAQINGHKYGQKKIMRKLAKDFAERVPSEIKDVTDAEV